MNNKTSVGFLLINKYGGQGGVEKILTTVAAKLKNIGIDCHLFYTDTPMHKEFLEDFQYIHFLQKAPKQIGWLKKINIIHKPLQKWRSKKLIDQQFQNLFAPLGIKTIIVINLPVDYCHLNERITYNKEKFGIKIFSWLHGSIAHLNEGEINHIKKSLPIYDHHIAICRGIQQELSSLLNKESTIVYNSITDSDLVSRNPKKLLYIGRIDKNKRVDGILEIVKNLKGQWQLDIIGSTGSISKDKEFEKLIHSLNLSEHVVFHGWKKKPWEIINEAGVLLLNSLSEGFGLVLAEAMIRGIPCISSLCPIGPAEIIQENINGWLYDINDYQKAANILQEVIDGKRVLPPQNQIRQTAEKFLIDNTIGSFLDTVTQNKKIV